MDFLKSGLKTVLGAPEPGQQPSPAETVERLVQRIHSSVLLEDRRDACRALKAMSRSYRIEVGAHAMNALKQVLELDRADNETMTYALDTLNNIMSPSPFEEEENNPSVPMNIGEQFTEIFIKEQDNIQFVLDLLDEYDFRVRLSAVQLLTSVLTNRPKDIQEIILVKPMAVSKMMDLLGDSREVIRNETLLLLIKLTKSNANIQKIVAFENAFDKLFEIVSSEGYSDGGIIVEDCLLLMLNLLKNNSSNINFFKEGSYIQRMVPMFTGGEAADEAGWSPQKVSNVHCMLLVVRTLVAPGNAPATVASCQRIMKDAGLLDAVCDILMSSGVPAAVLAEAIAAVGELARGCGAAQEALGRLAAPSAPPRPALVVLLMSMVNEKQPFALRCAILYCFQCYLHRNPLSQAAVVATLLPASGEVARVTSGQLLCGGLFSADALSNWFSAVTLMHAVLDNPAQKEQLLRVLLATNIGSSPVLLIHQCGTMLMQTTKLKTKVGLLMLLSAWCAACGGAVAALLALPGAAAWLAAAAAAPDDDDCLAQALAALLLAVCIHYNDNSVPNYSKEALLQLVSKRLGGDVLPGAVRALGRLEAYAQAARAPAPRAAAPPQLLLDYEFCNFYKATEGIIVQSLTGAENGEKEKSEIDSGALEQYKSLIRQQDARLTDLVRQLDALAQQNRALQAALNDSTAANSHLKDENTLLKAQLSTSTVPLAPPPADRSATELEDKLRASEERVRELEAEVKRLEAQLAARGEARGEASGEASGEARAELARLARDQDDLLLLLADQDMKLNEYRMRLVALGQAVDDAPGT